ncbi:MAG: TlpA disulfide reductase family protein [Ferruginibacter sp.]
MKNVSGFIIGLIVIAMGCTSRQELATGIWRAELTREDGKIIPFNFETKDSSGKKILYVQNANERLLVDSIIVSGDSVFIQMPFFESKIVAKMIGDNLQGAWIKAGKDSSQSMPFKAIYNTEGRFPSNATTSANNVSGRWAVNFINIVEGDTAFSVGEFVQKGEIVTGTFLNPSGDYRYLQGVVDGDSLKLSCFDGGHAYLFTATINGGQSLTNGFYYAGQTYMEKWVAHRDENASLPDGYGATKLKTTDSSLNFKFRSISGDSVSISDDRFKNKVVLIQLMGSWCPNCMDETQFLSDYYNKHRNNGIEIIALAYERSTDFERSAKAISLFQKRFDIQYPMLVTGVTVSDTLRAEKTLPQLDKINAFPTLIILDKRGKVRSIHSGFNGPATGIHYEHFKDEFSKLVGNLLKE